MYASLAVIASFALVFCIMPPLIRFANRIGFIDVPTERKQHEYPVPHIGGIAIFIGFFIIFFLFSRTINIKILAIFFCALLIVGIGILDDWYKATGREFSVLPKLLVQVFAATIVFSTGTAFHGFTNPFHPQVVIVFPIALQYIFTVLWIFGVTTVVNFMDGIDGLAGGVTAICATTLFIVSVVTNQSLPALMSVVLVGCILGFLKYNKPPAKVFLGDAGATFIGFMIAIISLEGVYKQATVISLFIPILALGVPIFDCLYVILKRFLARKPIYKADRSQLHYRLMLNGLSVKQVNIFIYLLSTCLCLTSIILLIINAGML